MKSKEKELLISIVVPVYNTEKLLLRCLDSLLNQTHKNVEIIIVNDCSPGDTIGVVSKYLEKHKNIKYVEHEQNKGLYQARITGSRYATGDFIAFVDSDDYVTLDYYRMMLSKAESENADIVCSWFFMERESDKHRYIFPFNRFYNDTLIGDEILETYFKLGRYAFARPIVWNKIYKKDLWDKAFPDLEAIIDSFISFEDVYYLTVLSHFAQKQVNIDYKGVVYYQNDDASTSMNDDPEKFERNICHISMAMGFVKEFLIKVGKYEQLQYEYNKWLDREVAVWSNTVKNSRMSEIEKKKIYEKIETGLQRKCVFEKNMFQYNICYMASMDFDNRQEIIRNEIQKHKSISFDLFGTLLHLPVIEKNDIYEYLDGYYPSNILGVEFSKIRHRTKSLLLEKYKYTQPHIQALHINEIYDEINKKYDIDEEFLKNIKQKEVNLFVNWAYVRQSMVDIFNMAVACGKDVIIIAETELDEKHIKIILNNNKIYGYNHLYITSSEKTKKADGILYKDLLQQYNIEKQDLYHVGGDWENDNVIPNKLGIKTFMYSSPKDRILNYSGDMDTSNLALTYYAKSKEHYDYQLATQYPLFKSILAIIANKIFDNPNIEYASGSDYNGNPYNIGYYAIGMYMLGITKWIIEQCRKNDIKQIEFQRQDILFKKTVDIVKKHYDYNLKCTFKNGESNYASAIFSFEPLGGDKLNLCLYNTCKREVNNVRYYYNFLPKITGEIRERFTREYRYHSNIEEYFHKKILQGTLDFVTDTSDLLGDCISILEVRKMDMIMPFERLLDFPQDFDTKIFGDSYIGKYKFKNVWKSKINNSKGQTTIVPLQISNYFDEPEMLMGMHPYKKAIYYFLIDRNVLKEKVKVKLYNKPKKLSVLKITYSCGRTIKKLILRG